MNDKINSFTEDYWFLSNYSYSPINWNGNNYCSAEAAFQSAKTLDKNLQKQFENLTPNEAKRLGRQIALRSDWEEVKEDIMYKVCFAKFTQNNDLRRRLLATGDAYLEEGNTWGDRIWGTVKGEGQNKLGKILMTIRSEIKGGWYPND